MFFSFSFSIGFCPLIVQQSTSPCRKKQVTYIILHRYKNNQANTVTGARLCDLRGYVGFDWLENWFKSWMGAIEVGSLSVLYNFSKMTCQIFTQIIINTWVWNFTLFCSAVIVVASKIDSSDYNTDRNPFRELERCRNGCNHIENTKCIHLTVCVTFLLESTKNILLILDGILFNLR